MSDLLRDLTDLPQPQYVMAGEGDRIATYSWGEDAGETVLVVHGFASSALDNWVSTGWVRDLLRAGFRVLAVDQLGHGASDRPHESSAYSMKGFVGALHTVLDTYLVDEVAYVGYSLGARVGWQFAVEHPDRVSRAVLGGIPDGRPLARIQLEQARAYLEHGTPVTDAATLSYLSLAERVHGNDLRAILALAEGLRLGDVDPDPQHPPLQPVLFATGGDDPIIERSRALAAATPRGTFIPIPGRHHFNTPGSRIFREAALRFLA